MIFKQWELVLSGKKTQTRRLMKPGDHSVITIIGKDKTGVQDDKNRWRFWLGQKLPVIPKRAKPMIWWKRHSLTNHLLTNVNFPEMTKAELMRADYMPARVEITELRIQHLHDISEADAQAEGVGDVAEYRELWTSINGKTRGARWEDNPLVVVIVFKLTPAGEAKARRHDPQARILRRFRSFSAQQRRPARTLGAAAGHRAAVAGAEAHQRAGAGGAVPSPPGTGRAGAVPSRRHGQRVGGAHGGGSGGAGATAARSDGIGGRS